MRRAVLAGLLCAAPLFAATAQASTETIEREQLRAALRSQARATASRVIPVPLSGRPRASAASSSDLARLASTAGPVRLLVGLRSHEDMDAVANALSSLGATPERFDITGVIAATVPSGAAAVAALRDNPRVAYVERDAELRTAADEFDTVDPATGIKYTWAYDAVRAGEAIAAIGGGSSRTVAVIDTGLDVNHPEFAGQVRRTLDATGSGSTVTDFAGHGSFVSGLIAALDGNGVGGKGVAGTTKLVAVRATRDAEGRFSLSDLIRGIELSIRAGASVMNMSLAGTDFTFQQGLAFRAALEAAFFNDVLPVAAAGNHGDSGNPLEFPAALIGGDRGRRGIGLSVGATMPNGQVASFSTHNRFVSLAAPGASAGDCKFGVFSTLPSTLALPWTSPSGCSLMLVGQGGARYAYGEGTSFSAPIVAGLAALAWQAERRLASEQVGEVLTRSAAGSGWNQFTGAGIADGMRAVEVARIYDVVSPRARARTHRRGNRVRVRVKRSRDRTSPGDELAGHLIYGLLVSRDGGRGFRAVASRRRRPFTKFVRIRGRRRNIIISTVCDRNGNCGVKRLGGFRRRG